MATPIEDYRAAEDYVNSLIMGPPSPPPGTPREVIHERATARLGRLRAFLAFIGNPQERYRTIHVAGTSGKGSTSVFTASILSQAGYRVGTHVSPYLQVATEKLQIDGRIVAATRYRTLVESMRTRVEDWVVAGHERLSYGEFWVAMTLQYFAEERVDVAVIEVGAGGRFDLTNVIHPVVAVVTSIGYDHMATLGSTLAEIAWHKAGIIKPGVRALSAVTEPEAVPVIEAEARKQDVAIEHVWHNAAYRDVVTDASGTSFTDARSGCRFRVSLPGTFQAANGALAVAAARAFQPSIADDVVASGLASARFPGRMEIVQREPVVMLDGAHNTEKVASLAQNLDRLFPHDRMVLVFGALESKDFREMFEVLAKRAAAIVATSPQVLAKPAVRAADIADLVPGHLPVASLDDPREAVEKGISLAGTEHPVLVTGSLYLVGNVRELWYPTERILEQGACWPE